MKAASSLFLLLILKMVAAEIADLGVITDKEGINLEYRMDEDVLTQIEVLHLKRGEWKPHGFFSLPYPTTNTVLYLHDLSMIPTGTNQFHIRRIFGGVTSPVTVVQFLIQRPISAPVVLKVERFPMLPPMPPGMVVPIPEATNHASYVDWQRAVKEGKRRSQ